MAIGGARSSFSLDPTGLFRGLAAAKKEYDRRALKAIKLGALFFEAEIKKELSKPGTGRARKTKGRKGTRKAGVTATGRARFRTVSGSNRASSPGEPPAVDLDGLRSSITHVIQKEFLVFIAQVGTNVEYAPALEFGRKDGSIKPRPFMLTTLARIRPKLIVIFQGALSG